VWKAIASLPCVTRRVSLGGKTTRRFQQINGLLAVRAVYDGDLPAITFPDGRRIRGDDPTRDTALSEALRLPVTLARESGVSHLDAGPVHLVTTASLAWLQALLGEVRIAW
jgi:MOSC domain-containing protein